MNPELQLTCEEVRADLPLFVGGDLFGDEHHMPTAEAVRQHMLDCEACAEEFASLERSRDAFLTLGEDSSAPGLWPDVRAVLASEGRFGGDVAPTPLLRFRPLAAAALVVAMGVFIWLQGSGSGVRSGTEGSSELVLDETLVPEGSTLASPLRPLLPDELALSEEAEVFGLNAGIDLVNPSHTSGGASAAGLNKIR